MHRISQDIVAMRELLGSWLASPEGLPETLISWLQGHNLPVSESGEEPYIWILRGLPLTHEREAARHRLAQRVAVVLQGQPDIHRPGRRTEQVLYNLLMLGAGLAWPEELADPLYEIYRRLSYSNLDLNLRSALRSALAENQLNERLEREWFSMIEGSRTGLPGNIYQGYYGILLMPSSPSERGRPNLRALGKALKLMAHNLESQDNRWQEFERLTEKIKIFGEPLPYEEILIQSQEHQWPAWAVLCLISFARITDDCKSELTGFVWSPLTRELPNTLDYQRLDTYHRGNVEKIRAPEKTWKFLFEFVRKVEIDIRRAPHKFSIDALREVLNHAMADQLVGAG